MKRTIIALVLLLSPALIFAQADPHQIFQAANQAYDQKDYPAAVEKYQSLLQKGYASAAVYYNLGNVYFRLGDLGQSIWCYRNGLELSPGDQDIKENLQFARLYRVDKIAEERGFFLAAVFSTLPVALGLNLLSWLAALSWWVTLGVWLAYLVYRRRSRIMQIATVASVAVFLLLGTSLWAGLKAEQKESAVVLSAQADAKSGPGEDYVSLFTVHQGLECQIEEEREGWYLIYLPDGTKGWVPSQALGLI
jgi:tetratricopeptide (TPR) repeat protein